MNFGLRQQLFDILHASFVSDRLYDEDIFAWIDEEFAPVIDAELDRVRGQ